MNYIHSFVADPAGNLTTLRSTSGLPYNSRNQYNPASGFVFDPNGNPTTYNGTAATFDAENHMTSFGTLMSASYRADGLRASKTSGGTATYYVYDPSGTPVLEMQSSSSVTAVNTFGIEGLVSRRSAGA